MKRKEKNAMNNTLNKTLYDVYAVVSLTNSSIVRGLPENARLTLCSGIAYLGEGINKIPVGYIPKAKEDVFYEKANDYFEALSANEVFNPGYKDNVFLTQDDLEKVIIRGDTFAIIRYVDDELAFVKLSYQLSEDDVDNLFSEIFNSSDLFDSIVVECCGDKLIKTSIKNTSESNEKTQKKNVKEEKSMNNLFGNLGFGKLKTDRFKLSMNGIAVAQSNGKYVVYNKENNEFVDVTEMLFDIKDALFSLPTVEIAVGDVILHNDKPYYIVDATNDIKAVSYEDCTQTVLIPRSTMFGLKFFTKIFSMFGNLAESSEIFSNPLMLMTLMSGEGNGDLSKMLMMSSLTKGDLGTNPMMLAMMLKDGDDKTDLSTLAMMSMMTGGTNPFAPSKAARNLNKTTPEKKEIKE